MCRSRWLILFVVCSAFAVRPLAPGLLAQEEKNPPGNKDKPGEKPEDAPPSGDEKEKGRPANADGYNAYFVISEAKYLPAAEGATGQAVQLKFDISPDVPKGAKIHLTFELFSVPLDETDYELKDENRKGLTYVWKFSKRMVTGKYQVRSFLRLKDEAGRPAQIPAVQRAIQQNTKAFPPKSEPWPWYWDQPVELGNAEDEAAESKELCTAYTDFMDRLIASMGEFIDKMGEVNEGKDLVKGAALDKEKFEAYVKDWREKQGAIQKEIALFVGKQPALVEKSKTAYLKLRQLGQMVSKRAVQEQTTVTEKYKVGVINPAAKDFDKSFRYKVDARSLNEAYNNIRQLVGCPAEAEAEAGAEGAAEPGAEAGAGAEKGAEAKDGEEKAPEGDEPEAKPEAKPETKDGAKAKPAEKSSGKSTKKAAK
jgi:hypothetical protein